MATPREETNKLALQQEEIGKNITRILTNAKKDAVVRKTPEYINVRTTTLNQLMEECQAQHTKIEELGDMQHTYFTSNYFSQIQKRYQEAIKYLSECPKATIPTKEPANDADQVLRLRKQEVKIDQLDHIFKLIDHELAEDNNSIRYESLLKKITKQWNSVQELHEELMVYEDKFDKPYFKKNIIWDVEFRYDNAVENLEMKISELTKTSKPNIILPKIQLPFFEGGYERWSTFHDIFVKLIHGNTSLTRIEKMQYLKTHVRGEASKLIQHLQITDGNYEDAWDLLLKRYQNTRLILAKLIDEILDLPTVQKESTAQIQRLHDVVQECLKAINNLGIDTESWGPLIGRIISRKWDTETNKLYEQSLSNPNQIQTLSSLMKFLERRFQSLEAISSSKKTFNGHQSPKNYNNYKHGGKPTSCAMCQQSHFISQCPNFISLNPPERMQAIKEKKLCINCLSHVWTGEPCQKQKRCFKCNKSHHTMLHPEIRSNINEKTARVTKTAVHTVTAEETSPKNASDSETPITMNQNPSIQDHTVLLATALVRTKSSSGNLEYLRVLIDSGSQAAFVTERAAQLLGQPRQKIAANISGLGEGNPKLAKSKIQCEIFPRFPSNFSLTVNFLVLPKLTQTLPNKQLDSSIPSTWQNYILADPTFHQPGPIDAILGAEEVGHIMQQGLQKTKDGPLGQETKFGWILSGSIKHAQVNNAKIVSMVSRFEEDKQLTKFWDIEETTSHTPLSRANEECEKHYEETVKRNSDGTYTVRIPFTENPPKLGDSKSKALARFMQLEKTKLNKPSNKELRKQYNAFMQEYLDLGHMRLVPPHQRNDGKYYIPHQPVIRESSTTTKLRVVFDASSTTSNGLSLNENMHIGPRLQQELTDMLIRWRKHPVVFSADVEKMYRQIRIAEEDQQYHRILWRFDNTQPIQEYCLTTVTYGTASAPYLAIKTLQKLAIDEKNNFPRASSIALQDFYVDDLMSGTDTVEDAVQLQSEIIALLNSGGFNLRKWSSNKEELLVRLPEEMRDQTITEITEDGIKKALGVYWAPYDDTIRFKVETTHHTSITKRNILSEIAKLFDPLGWLAPVIIQAKLLIQELWLQNLDWDQPVPAFIRDKWTTLHENLKSVEDIHFPRWIQHTSKNNAKFELHGFCDASEKAYGAVIYARTVSNTGNIHTTLLVAKSKVAPARTKTSLPRLELCASVLLAKLMARTTTALGISDVEQFAWTDSMITLAWIKGDPARWKTFVANRVSEVISLLPAQHWHHVSTKDNPADMVSRGICPSKMKNSTLWWNGPSWLLTSSQWLTTPNETPHTELEQKQCLQATVQSVNSSLTERFSSFTRMIRVLSYCNRFTRRSPKKTGRLITEELEETTNQVIKLVQQDALHAEITALKTNKSLNKNSKIHNLNPFLDNKGILRVGGRLKNSSLPYDQKHPVILPYQSHFTTLIIRNAHQQTLHGGIQLTLSYTRRKYWIINGKRAVRSLIHKCTICIRHKAETVNQLMGDLPAPRVTPSPPFSHTGVDYAGPIAIRALKGRGHKSYKGYIAVFVCFATKAVHLEAVSDMTTEAFLAAFRRFSSRRGHCAHMYSDNGTNFVGASNEFKDEVLSILQNPELQDQLVTNYTQWHFIPPASPHFGGLWEAGVKSMKFHLKRIIGDATLTFEELTTLLCQIEACLNSRPLCTLSNDISDLDVITPGHFLIGREIVSPSHPAITDSSTNLTTRWKTIQKMKKDFWNSWSSEYLGKLQQRYKWQTLENNPKVGDIVILKEDKINPSKWPLAKISEIHPDHDGNIRVVTIKKVDSQPMKRSIHRLIPLPVEKEMEPPQPKKVEANHTIITQELQPDNSFNKFHHTQKSSFLLKTVLILWVLISVFPHKNQAGYTVKNLNPGLYVEHLGHARIERGIFRVELKYKKEKINKDVELMYKVISEFEDLCNQTKSLSSNVQCFTLTHHLKEVGQQMKWIQNTLEDSISARQKRGLLGQLLTSVFGVNDEVYQDIDALQQNQQELLKAANHQTKFMISSLANFNETEERINRRLEQFRTKLNQGLEAINDMKGWYGAADTNALNIHILSSFQVANNFVSETFQYYSRIYNARVRRGNLHDLISPDHVNQIINQAHKRLPSTLNIISDPIIKMTVETDQEYIHMFSHFLLVGMSNFTVMKITPIPLRMENNSYWITEVNIGVIAVDYNLQQYFELKDEELKNSISLSMNDYVCSPAAVKNIETSPNCLIDEIYQRIEATKCRIIRSDIFSTIWKELYTTNAWMVIVNKPSRIAITCNGNRQDTTLNQTCILQISQDCIVKTKQNILTPKHIDAVPVLASYSKTITLDNYTLEQNIINPIQLIEPVFKNSEKLDSLRNTEQAIQDDLQETTWKRIQHHSMTISSITTVTILFVISICLVTYKCWKHWHWCQPSTINRRSPSEPRTEEEMIELQPM